MPEETRAERAARRSREELNAKRRAKGSPSGSPTTDRPRSFSSRASKRAEEEQEAKRRAREGGRSSRTSTRTSTSRSRTRRQSTEDAEAKRRARGGSTSLDRRSRHRTSNRESEDREAKRRARGGPSRSVATPGAYSAASSSSDRISRKSERHRHSSQTSRSSRSPRRSDSDREAKRRARGGRRSNPTPGAASSIASNASPEPAAAVQANESGTVELQAMAVEDMEDERMMKLEEANQKLQKQMEDMARGQRGESPQNGGSNRDIPAGTAVETDSEDEDEEETGGKSNKRMWVVLVVLLIVAIGAGAAIALAGGGSSDPVTGPDTTTTTAPGGDASTNAPVAISDSPTDSPSGSPTATRLFAPPKVDDCAAMAEGKPVSDQVDLIQRDFTVTLSVVLNNEADLATLESRLQQSLQEVLIPKLAGCPPVSQRKMRANHNHRNLNIDPFAIGNGRTDVTCQLAESCADSSTIGTCYDCLLTLGVDLKDEGIKNLDLFGKIGSAFGEDTLISDLGLDDLVGRLNALGVVAGTPSDAPSSPPTGIPSVAPSGMPSSQPSGMPTGKPTGPPTMAPTTSPPTKQPTPGPTPPPSPPPTPGPTQPPTPPPTPEPTPPPTRATPQPTLATPPPTKAPTAATKAPTTPTKAPTVNCQSVQSLFEGGSYETQSSHTSTDDYSLACAPFALPIYALIVGSDGCHSCAGVLFPYAYAGACAYDPYGTATFRLENSVAEGQTVYYGYSSEFGDMAILPSCPEVQMTYTGPPDEGPPMDDDDFVGDDATGP